MLIDYAHTPDAVAAIVDSACASERPVWVVLGCGGDRDRSKRPLMAKASSAADQLVFTSDNPRSESPQRIVEDMLQGCENQRSVHVDLDRRSAISWAVCNAPDGATLLILGKGHESVQIIDDTRVPFSDVEVAFEALQVEGRLR